VQKVSRRRPRSDILSSLRNGTFTFESDRHSRSMMQKLTMRKPEQIRLAPTRRSLAMTQSAFEVENAHPANNAPNGALNCAGSCLLLSCNFAGVTS